MIRKLVILSLLTLLPSCYPMESPMKTIESVANAGKTGSQARPVTAPCNSGIRTTMEYEALFRSGALRMAGADHSYESFGIKGYTSDPFFYESAPGPWLGRVFAFLDQSISRTRQGVFFWHSCWRSALQRRTITDVDGRRHATILRNPWKLLARFQN